MGVRKQLHHRNGIDYYLLVSLEYVAKQKMHGKFHNNYLLFVFKYLYIDSYLTLIYLYFISI